MLLVHKKSGARICVMSNEDANKVFYIAFRTPPKDSTGVPHIIEHTVLCGSKKFPVKDPFIELVKGSLNTFLNAMTYPDKTIYPVASCNDKDFQNLMDVYLDSVFSPNIYREQNIFRQEGWHYELKNPEDELTLNGVVYNEMKGAFSSADGVLDREILRSLFPDTPYSNESGGDPQVIPELTYEEYLNFHRQYYHPSNSYIYLYGDMDVVEKLNWLDQEYLSHYDKIEVDSSIPEQKPFDAPKEHEIPYSISSTDSTENNTYLSCNWAVGTNLDRELYIAFDILDYALLSTQGAPVKQALLDAGIGTDIYGGYDSSSYQPIFSIVAKHANASDQKRFEQVIRDVLQEQVKNGINKKTLLAAINGSEFKFREADFGCFPKGLMFGLQVMDSWLYDENAPFLHMEELGVYDYLRKQLDTDYFEQLIQKYLLDNTHVSYVRIVPEVGLTGKREQALKEKLQAYKATLSKEEIEKTKNEKEEAVLNQKFEKAAELRDTEKALREKFEKEQSKWKNKNTKSIVTITEENIAEVIANWTGIPAKKITEDENEKLKNLEKELHKRVIGQNEAVEAVSKAIRRSRVGLKDPKRPIGSFLFLGPTGVGKTELSKALAEVLFGDENAMIRLDMSEFMEPHSVSKLIGAPPGYVGFDDGGQLTEKIRRKPYSVILFDEIEKAHPDVMNMLLQILEDGRLTDSQGRTVNFKNTVIIMTSNLGARLITDRKQLGFANQGAVNKISENVKEKLDENSSDTKKLKDMKYNKELKESSAQDEKAKKEYEEIKKEVMAELKKELRPEFINRIDEIIVFHKLNDNDINQIIDIMLKEVVNRLKEQKYEIEFEPDVKEMIAKEGIDKNFGARPLRRTIQNLVEDKLAEEILDGKLKKGKVNKITVRQLGQS